MGVKREIPSALLTENWEKVLVSYHDAEIVQYLKYGCMTCILYCP